MLDWLGDLGGLFDALRYICAVLVQPVTAFTLKTTLLTAFFRFKPAESKNEEQKVAGDDSDGDQALTKKISTEFAAS